MRKSREYAAWKSMRQRCNDPNCKAYKYYGARGIRDKFLNFEEFFSHLGQCPTSMSLDRIDNNGHYEKGNVRWADSLTQMNNRSDNLKFTYKGKTQALSEWSREIGISVGTLWYRFAKARWPIDRVLNDPLLTQSDAGKLGAKARWD